MTKMQMVENIINLSSNSSFQQEKSLVPMVTYIFDHYGQRAIRKCDKDIMSQFLEMALSLLSFRCWGWSGGAMVLGKLPVTGRRTISIRVGQGPTALVVGAGGGCLDILTLIYPVLSSFSLSLGDGSI